MLRNIWSSVNRLRERRKDFFKNIYRSTQQYLKNWGIQKSETADFDLKKQKILVKFSAIFILFFYVPMFFLLKNIFSGSLSLIPGILFAMNAKYLWGGKQKKLEHQDWHSIFGFWLGTSVGLILGGSLGLAALIFVRFPYHNMISFIRVIEPSQDDKRQAYEKRLGFFGKIVGQTILFFYHFLVSGYLRFLEINDWFADPPKGDISNEQTYKTQEKPFAKALSYIFLAIPALILNFAYQLVLGSGMGIGDAFNEKSRTMTYTQWAARCCFYFPFYIAAYIFDGLWIQGLKTFIALVKNAYIWVSNDKESKQLTVFDKKRILSWILGLGLGVPVATLTVLFGGFSRVISGFSTGIRNAYESAIALTFEKNKNLNEQQLENIEYYSSRLAYGVSLPFWVICIGTSIMLWDNLKGLVNGVLSVSSIPAIKDLNSFKRSYTTRWSEKTVLFAWFSGVLMGLPIAALIAVANFINHSTQSFYYAVIDGYRLASKAEKSDADKRVQKARNYGLWAYILGFGLGYLFYSIPQFLKEFSIQGYQDALKKYTEDAAMPSVEKKNIDANWRSFFGNLLVYPFGYTFGLGVSMVINSYQSFNYILLNSHRLALMGRPSSEKLDAGPGRFLTGSPGYLSGAIIAVPVIFSTFLLRIALDNLEMISIAYALTSAQIEGTHTKSTLSNYRFFDKILGGLGIILGTTFAFSLILAKYSFQDLNNWWAWLGTRSITEIYDPQKQSLRLMGIPGFMIGSTLGLTTLILLTGLRWGLYDPIMGTSKGMQAFFWDTKRPDLYQVQYVFYPVGIFLAIQLKEAFYKTLEIVHFTVSDIFKEKINHKMNKVGLLGIMVGTALGLMLGIAVSMIRFLSYDLIQGASIGWRLAYSKFRKADQPEVIQVLSKGAYFWNIVFFGLGLSLMSQYFGFMKFIPIGLNIVWKGRLHSQNYFNSDDPDLSVWYFPGLISIALAIVLTIGLGVGFFCIRSVYEAWEGMQDGFRNNPMSETLQQPYQLIYQNFYSTAQFSLYAYALVCFLPNIDKEKLPDVPEKRYILGSLIGVILGGSLGLLVAVVIMMKRFVLENITTMQEGFIKLACMEEYDTERTKLAVYGYSGVSYLFARAIGMTVVFLSMLYIGFIHTLIVRPLTMTRGRFKDLDNKDTQVIKIKNLYAAVNNWDRAIDIEIIQNIPENACYSGGKGIHCFFAKSLTLSDDYSPSELFLEDLVAEKRKKDPLTVEKITKIAEEKLTTEQCAAVVNYLCPNMT